MKLNALNAAIVAAGALMANGAFALVPSAPIDMHIYASGATAQDKALQTMATKLCDTGTLHVYTDSLTKPEGSSYSAYACTMSQAKVPTLSVPSLNVMFHKRSKGGSGWGVGPVAAPRIASNAIPQMVISDANCTDSGTTATINGVAVPLWTCSNANTVDVLSEVGISDVEPVLFSKSSNLIPVGTAYGTVTGDPGTYPIPDADLAALTVRGMSSVTFGIPVTLSLRNALQLAQGKTVGSDDVSQMPSLTKEQINSIFTGTVGTWANFKVLDTNTSTYVGLNSLSTLAGAGISAPATARINVCRRDPGSGTQAQFNALFLADGCTGSTLSAALDNTPSSAHTAGTGVTTQPFGSGLVVHENAGSGDVDSCLSNLQTGNIWAVGVQSLEKGNANYRFVAVDGVAPTLKNVATNKYWDWAANSIQWRSDTVTGDKLNIVNKIADEISNPVDLATLNASFNPRITGTDSNVGLLALNTNGSPKYTGTIPFAASNPVMTVTRNGPLGTSAPNTCKAAVVLSGSSSQIIQ